MGIRARIEANFLPMDDLQLRESEKIDECSSPRSLGFEMERGDHARRVKQVRAVWEPGIKSKKKGIFLGIGETRGQ
jgi:hypothetical protein